MSSTSSGVYSGYWTLKQFKKTRLVACSLGDQALAVGGGFLANVILARAQSKEAYGMFVLCYSVFSFLLGLYYAAILEAYTVYGAGRYRERFGEYSWLIVKSNWVICLTLTLILLIGCGILSSVAPQFMSRAILGLAVSAGLILSGYFLRRAFYVQRQPALAFGSSTVFFMTVTGLLFLASKANRLSSFSVFLILASGWLVAWAVFGRRVHLIKREDGFLQSEPHYWAEHWKYSKWVLATAFVFQFTTQGYYWLVGFFLSASDVANVRALYLVVGPVEQISIAVSYLIVPALAARYAAGNMSEFLSLTKRYVLAMIGVTGLYALAVRITGRQLVHLLYSGKYDGLTGYLFVLAFLPLVIWTGSALAQALNAAEKPQFAFWAYTSSGVATFLVGIPLVIHYGLWGAVYGMIFSGMTYAVALAVSFFLTVRGETNGRATLIDTRLELEPAVQRNSAD